MTSPYPTLFCLSIEGSSDVDSVRDDEGTLIIYLALIGVKRALRWRPIGVSSWIQRHGCLDSVDCIY